MGKTENKKPELSSYDPRGPTAPVTRPIPLTPPGCFFPAASTPRENIEGMIERLKTLIHSPTAEEPTFRHTRDWFPIMQHALE